MSSEDLKMLARKDLDLLLMTCVEAWRSLRLNVQPPDPWTSHLESGAGVGVGVGIGIGWNKIRNRNANRNCEWQ